MPINIKFLNENYELSEKWFDILTHFLLLDKHNKFPDKNWYKELETLIEKISSEEFIKTGISWINNCIEHARVSHNKFSKIGIVTAYDSIQSGLGISNTKMPEWVSKVYGKDVFEDSFFKREDYAYLDEFQNYFYQSIGGRILRGFLHSSLILNDKEIFELVDKFAFSNPNHAQDPIYIYSKISKEIGVPKLSMLKTRVRNKNIISRINKAFEEIGKKSKMSKEEIEESLVPDFGINGESVFIQDINGYKCCYKISNYKTSRTYYLNPDGKEQKSLPTTISNFKDDIKLFKANLKEIDLVLSSSRKRIEGFYLNDRTIPFSEFLNKYLDHKLMNIIAKDLIWTFRNKSDLTVSLFYLNGEFVNQSNEVYRESLDDCEVSLWHPIGVDRQVVFLWREFMVKHEILQPIKQAFREVYIITDAEVNTSTYSNRYASHILNKDHCYALAKGRLWSVSGLINDGKLSFSIPQKKLKVEFWSSEVNLSEYSKFYGSLHISTDQVRFYKDKELIELIEVPAIIFSEVMRDIDLFVGVTSIGNDPSWYDRGLQNANSYWSEYVNSELKGYSITRLEILSSLISKLKISKSCSIEGKYLKVQGKRRSYKIHIGSGNILMEPNDQYLCIVANREHSSTKKLFIPFEGDHLLSIIISKAFLLADDDKITDSTILRQIM